MADGVVQVPPDSTGKIIDTSELTVGAKTVERQRIVLGSPTSATALADISGTSLQVHETGSPIVSVGGTVAVTGAFWQATQPISGSISVSNFPATQPVSGTVAISGTVPVSGTFWQATQPVSGTVNIQGGNSTAVKVDGSAVTQPVSGTFWQNTQGVALTQLGGGAPTTNAGSTASGTLRIVQATGATFNTNQSAPGTTAAVLIAANANRIRVVITQMGTTPVFIGGSGVTAANGDLLPGVVGYQKVFRVSVALYAIVSAGTGSVSYYEEAA